ncbi:3'-5' exonuclease domain and Ribonuclease H-like domain-containing protein [Strongyloides ratti]|uniref:3'-5' exonuclease domain and Ribonuclease H-like domain-containing protein n=1 Tax=Strongyloides ratti TaxID=34506 RepID=A0A090LFA7_STRRB|nr:3'-5' exonuclease domain and Ribonuclease H-like domain-containing protein [Strongyloides ratti]CEF68476.1 3'-5' exonuclease domain and Ribonuclease H-like domain-containing protein [Strongyloides ratti]
MEGQGEINLSNAKLLQSINTQKFFNKCHCDYAKEFSFQLYKNVNTKNQFLKHVNLYFDYIKNLSNDSNLLDTFNRSRFNGSKNISNQKVLRKVVIHSFYLFYNTNHLEKDENDENPSKLKKKSTAKKKKINFSLETSDHIAILEIICLKAHDDKNSLIKLHMNNFELLKSREILCNEIYNLINSGKYYFQILNFMLTDKGNFPFIDSPKLFENLAFLGPIHAKSLEEIVDSKDETFFQDTIKVLKKLRCYMENFDLFEEFYMKTIRRKVKPEYFNIFRENVRNLFTRLKRQNNSKEPISMTTAIVQLKRHVKMRYHQKLIDSYYLNDVAYIIISQHPSLKSTFENLLEKEKDFEELSRWKKLYIKNDPFPQYFPFEDKINDSLYAEKQNYLTLPKAIDAIKIANKTGFTIVGFDCEWSPFTINQSVSLIQVSLNNTCFIIDACYGDRELIGIKPKGDIIELLKTFCNVDALYNPTHTLCLTDLIKRFNVADSKNFKSDNNVEQITGNIDFIVPNWKEFFSEFNDKKNSRKKNNNSSENKKNDENKSDVGIEEDIDIIPDNENRPSLMELSIVNDEMDDNDTLKIEGSSEDNNSIKEKKLKKEKEVLTDVQKFDRVITCTGLSRLCKLILGKELEKIEQCSVWDRRPLRMSQIRYAALDAEASRMIFLKLEEWGKELNINVRNIIYNCPIFTLKKSRFISIEF